MYTTWANTEKVGWVRLAFDRWEIPFDLIHKDHVQAGANLRAKYDVIVDAAPDARTASRSSTSSRSCRSRCPTGRATSSSRSACMRRPTTCAAAWASTGAAEFQKFVEEGGVLVTFGVASYFPAEFGIAKGVDAQRPATGLLRARARTCNSEILHPDASDDVTATRRRRCRCATPAARCCRPGRRPELRAVRRHRRRSGRR